MACDYLAYFIYHSIRQTNANESNKLSYCVKLTFGSDVLCTQRIALSVFVLEHGKLYTTYNTHIASKHEHMYTTNQQQQTNQTHTRQLFL